MDAMLVRLHQELEDKVKDSKYFHDYAGIVKEIIGDPAVLDKTVLELIRAEIQVFQFTIRRNELKPMFIWTDEKGMHVEEPDVKNFSNEQLEYLITRQKECKDRILKARYSHVLWLSRVKKIDFAKEAIDSYLELINYYATQDSLETERDHWLAFLEVIRNLVPLSASINYKLEVVKALVINYALNYPIKSKAASVVRKSLTELMLEQKTIFQLSDFAGIVTSLELVFETVKKTQLDHAVEILEVIVVIDQKLGNDVIRWKRFIAEMWEKIARERGVDAALVTTNFCMKAILAYEEINDQAKVAELYTFYEELRNNVELHSIPLGSESKELFEFADQLSKQVVAWESEEIISFLMTDKLIIPRRNQIAKSDDDSENSFLNDVHTTVFDQQGNTNRHYSTDSEKNIEHLIFSYGIWIEHCFQIINLIITGAIKSRKLTYHVVLQYLIKESWYGQELEIGKRKDTKRPFRWLSIIAPGIVDFFVAMDGLIYSNKIFNIATSYDSLTMKIEGIVRTLAEYQGIPTFVIKRDHKGREVSEEKDIMRLLTEPAVVEFIGEDDVFFLRFVFTEKGGLNLRNKVAHSLLSYDQYSIAHLMLIFIAILRLGRFKLTPRSKA
jgi:Domain of unknown function (DUF4209)